MPDTCAGLDLPLALRRTKVLTCSLDGHAQWSMVAAGAERETVDPHRLRAGRLGADESAVLMTLVDVADSLW